MARISNITRATKETKISCMLNLDGEGHFTGTTGIGFFDHMLAGFAKHGFFDLNLEIAGDLEVDGHHTIEDAGIVLGTAIREALGDKNGICRYGSQILPMDETLMLCAIDLSGRPYFCYDVNLSAERVGEMDTELAKEFFYAISYSAGMNLHIRQLAGENNHHILEAMFKAFGRALDAASKYDARIQGVLSTKGTI